MNILPRRSFLGQSLLTAGSIVSSTAWLKPAEADEPAANRLDDVRAKTLRFISSMRFADRPYGRFRYAAGMSKPTLYSSTYAAMARHLYRDLGSLSETQRQEWIDYLQAHQDDDGLFRDPIIFGEGWYKNDPLWCGRPHLSCHMATALTCLGAVASKPLGWLDPFLDHDKLLRWLEQRDWGRKVAWTGNEVLNVGTLMQYARDFQQDKRCDEAVNAIRRWMTERCDPKTGLWGVGPLKLDSAVDRSQAVQAAYHFWLLWFYDRKPIPYADKALDEVLRTQNPQGGFGWGVHNGVKPFDSSACEDIDSIDPLARLMTSSKDRRADVCRALERALPWVLSNHTPSGSYCFMRDRGFSYGHSQLSAGAGAGAMFPTWFRSLTLAYLGKALPESAVGRYDWQFCNCPGLQFWRNR